MPTNFSPFTTRAWARSAVTAVLLISAAPALAEQGVSWTAVQSKSLESSVRPLRRLDYPVPDLDRAAAERLRRSASVYVLPSSAPAYSLMVYDHVTRCALVGSGTAGLARPALGPWVRYPDMTMKTGGPAMSLDGIRALRQFAAGSAPQADPACASAVEQAYGTDPGRTRGAAKLAQHAAAVRRDGKIGSSEAPLSVNALRESIGAILAAQYTVPDSQLLAATNDGQVTTVIVGRPGGASRLATMYRNLPDGRWRFLSASILGVGAAHLYSGGRTK